MPFSTPRLRLGLLGLALIVGAPASLVVASPAGAQQASRAQAPIVQTVTETDASGDTDDASTDIVSATVTHDRTNGIITAKVTFAGDPTVNRTNWIHAGLGFSYGSGTCYIAKELNGIAHLRTRMDAPDARWSISAPTDISGPATKVVEGSTITLTSQPSANLKTQYACMAVGLFPSDAEGELLGTDQHLIDSVFRAMPRDTATPMPTPPPAAKDGKPQVALDRDGDTVPDATDKCPDVPGAGTDGCLTTPVAKALKLGTKRLVVDHLAKRAGTKCPVAVKATVTAKGRTLGKQKLGVIAKGDWCHVAGVVKLKKRAKQVRVVIAGTGIAPVKQVVKS